MIVVFAGDPLELSRAWRDGSDTVRVIVSRDVGPASPELVKGNMQLARIDRAGVVTAVPQPTQSISEFLEEAK